MFLARPCTNESQVLSRRGGAWGASQGAWGALWETFSALQAVWGSWLRIAQKASESLAQRHGPKWHMSIGFIVAGFGREPALNSCLRPEVVLRNSHRS